MGVVVLFAANINYDAEAGRPRVQCNPNVQYLLDNNETLLQPLRRRGVKVLLGLLGNHDITGLAQLSEQGAKDFAREVAQYCKAYNLDGVNYDDEYSNSPDLSNRLLLIQVRLLQLVCVMKPNRQCRINWLLYLIGDRCMV